MAHLRARLSGGLMLLFGLLSLSDASAWRGTTTGDEVLIVVILAPLPLVGLAVLWAGERASSLGVVLSQCLVEVALIPITYLNVRSGHNAMPGVTGLIVPILISAVFAERRWHVALQVVVTIFSASMTITIILGSSQLLRVIPGESFAYIAAAFIVRMFRELAEDGIRRSEQSLRRAEVATRKAELGEMTDPLTGLLNRRGFERAGGDAWSRCAREQVPLAILLIDLDHFKRVNDTLGHLAGDDTLRDFANQLNNLLGENDEAFRIGGEEFVVVARCQPGGGLEIAERIRAAIERELSVTVSIGVSEAIPDVVSDGVADLWQAIDTADQGLYAAKSAGRNRVMAADAVRRTPPAMTRSSAQ